MSADAVNRRISQLRRKLTNKQLYDVLRPVFDDLRPLTTEKAIVGGVRMPVFERLDVKMLTSVIRRNASFVELSANNLGVWPRMYLKYLALRYPNVHFYDRINYSNLIGLGFRLRNTNVLNLIACSIRIEGLGGHAIMVAMQNNTFRLYDPNGYDTEMMGPMLRSWWNNFKTDMSKFYPDYGYLYATETCNAVGIQQTEFDNDLNVIDELPGYCQTFVLMMMHMCALNNSYDFKKMENAIVGYCENLKALNIYTREYFLFSVNLMYKVMRFAVIDVGGEAWNLYPDDLCNKVVLRCVLLIPSHPLCKSIRCYYFNPAHFLTVYTEKQQQVLVDQNVLSPTGADPHRQHYISESRYQEITLSDYCSKIFDPNYVNTSSDVQSTSTT